MFRLVIFSCLFLAIIAASYRRTKPTQGRIIGGQDTDITKVPHLVSVQYNNKHECGGSIIESKYILTAAHCIKYKDEKLFSVRAGSNYDYEDGDVLEVVQVIYHPSFNADTYDYDAAILVLEECLVLDEKARIAILSNDEPTKGDTVMISGWGSIEQGGVGWNIIQSVELPVIPREVCKTKYPSNTITNQMFCAGYLEGGKDSCKGDSGGPAMVKGKLAGIVSWGVGCGKKNYPGVYTNIASIKHWISREIKK